MTLGQIKAELRRSAIEDEFPYIGCSKDAHEAAVSYTNPHEFLYLFRYSTEIRTFYLLVAEAL